MNDRGFLERMYELMSARAFWTRRIEHSRPGRGERWVGYPEAVDRAVLDLVETYTRECNLALAVQRGLPVVAEAARVRADRLRGPRKTRPTLAGTAVDEYRRLVGGHRAPASPQPTATDFERLADWNQFRIVERIEGGSLVDTAFPPADPSGRRMRWTDFHAYIAERVEAVHSDRPDPHAGESADPTPAAARLAAVSAVSAGTRAEMAYLSLATAAGRQNRNTLWTALYDWEFVQPKNRPNRRDRGVDSAAHALWAAHVVGFVDAWRAQGSPVAAEAEDVADALVADAVVAPAALKALRTGIRMAGLNGDAVEVLVRSIATNAAHAAGLLRPQFTQKATPERTLVDRTLARHSAVPFGTSHADAVWAAVRAGTDEVAAVLVEQAVAAWSGGAPDGTARPVGTRLESVRKAMSVVAGEFAEDYGRWSTATAEAWTAVPALTALGPTITVTTRSGVKPSQMPQRRPTHGLHVAHRFS